MRISTWMSMCAVASLLQTQSVARAGEAKATGSISVAVLPMEAANPADREAAQSVTSLLYASLSGYSKLKLVEREKLDDLLKEQATTLAGLTAEQKGVRVGQLLAAKIVIFGRMTRLGNQMVLSARAIGTETSQLLAVTQTAYLADLAKGATALADKLAETIDRRGSEILAPAEKKDDLIGDLKKALAGKKLPRAMIVVPERYLGAAPDPAVETELRVTLEACGFEMVEAAKVKEAIGDKKERDWWLQAGNMTDIVIVGESILDRGPQNGTLFSGKARVELRAIDPKSGAVLASSRATKAAVDVSALLAAKSAAEQATRELMREFVPATVEAWGKQKPAAAAKDKDKKKP